MLSNHRQQAAFDPKSDSPRSLQLLLFIDERSSSQEPIQRLQNHLQGLQQAHPFELQVVEVAKQPHLVEHFRLVATPALVKIAPEPRQTLAGNDIIAQLERCWQQWLAESQSAPDSSREDGQRNCVGDRAELIRLSDEIFRLEREKQELQEQLRFKDRVLAMLAHDLRNPLTAASIAFETIELARDSQDPQRSAQLSKQIYKQAQNQFRIMNRMITDILQTAKGTSAELGLQPQRIHLQTLGEEVLARFSESWQAKSLSLTKDIPQDLPDAYGDGELVRQVLVNLLDNATKYTPPGGEIALSMLHRTTQKIQVSISDTGPGIPPEKREQIFEGHVRLQRDEAKEGYGLGLSLCRQIVRAHYGQIWVDSAPQRGSCFHFTIPVYRA